MVNLQNTAANATQTTNDQQGQVQTSNDLQGQVQTTTDQQGQKQIVNDQQGQKPKSPKQRKRRGATPQIWRVLSKANRTFKPQLTKNNAIKLQCVTNHIPSYYPDEGIFWSDYMKEAEKLMNSVRYLRECKVLNATPINVAEHIVFLGSATVSKVLKHGVENTLGKKYKYYIERFTPTIADSVREEVITASIA